MSRKGSTGEIKVVWYPGATIASLAAPDLSSELTGGIDLTPEMRRDGLTTPRSAATIDASDAANRQDKTAPGNIAAGTVTYRGQRDPDVDAAWDALAEDEDGVLLVRRFGGSSVAVAATDKVEIYVGTVITREMQPIGDETQNFIATLSIADQEQDATVAA